MADEAVKRYLVVISPIGDLEKQLNGYYANGYALVPGSFAKEPHGGPATCLMEIRAEDVPTPADAGKLALVPPPESGDPDAEHKIVYDSTGLIVLNTYPPDSEEAAEYPAGSDRWGDAIDKGLNVVDADPETPLDDEPTVATPGDPEVPTVDPAVVKALTLGPAPGNAGEQPKRDRPMIGHDHGSIVGQPPKG